MPAPVRPDARTAAKTKSWKQVLFGGRQFTFNTSSYMKKNTKEFHPWSLGYHTGTDISHGIGRGTPVYTPLKGTVVKAGRNVEGSAYGNAVLIHLDTGEYMLFAHLDSVGVSKGDRVSAGTFVGRVGDTGAHGEVHLHLEVRSAKSGGKFGPGNFLDPIAFLNKQPQSRNVQTKAPSGNPPADDNGGGDTKTTTTSNGGNGGGIKGVGGFTKAEYYKWLDAKFGSIAILRDLDKAARKELGGKSIDWLVDTLAKEKITDESIVATYMAQTGWFKKYGVDASQRLVSERLRPGVFAENVAAQKSAIQAQLGQMGFALSDRAINQLARDTYIYGWDVGRAVDEAQKLYADTGDVTYDGGSIGQAEDALQAAAFDLGVDITEQDLRSLRQDVIDGKGYQSQLDDLRERSAKMYSVFSDQILAGQSLRNVASEYFNRAATLLELGSPDQIEMNDPLFNSGRAFMTTDPATGKFAQKGLWDFEKEIRQDPRWLQTKNARDDTFNTAKNVLQLMGLA